jgi:Trk K+ transport system NAD-binding subunit
MRVGIAGIGRMGSAIAARLQEVGEDLVVVTKADDTECWIATVRTMAPAWHSVG